MFVIPKVSELNVSVSKTVVNSVNFVVKTFLPFMSEPSIKFIVAPCCSFTTDWLLSLSFVIDVLPLFLVVNLTDMFKSSKLTGMFLEESNSP
jgi:hypothetical protein